MHLPNLSDYPFRTILTLVCNGLALGMAIGDRRSGRFKWIRWYVVLCVGFSSLIYVLPGVLPPTEHFRWFDLGIMGGYTTLESWLIYLLLRDASLPYSRSAARDTSLTIFFYFWLLILLGQPRLVLADTATMMAAESLSVTVLTFSRLESKLDSRTFSDFMRSDSFASLLRTIGYFSFSMPVFLLFVLLESSDYPDVMLNHCGELVTYAGFFVMTRNQLHAYPLR